MLVIYCSTSDIKYLFRVYKGFGMKQVVVRKGKVLVENIPAPICEDGYILVRTFSSCISSGTEIAGISASGESILKKVINNPENIIKGLKMVSKNGIGKTSSIVKRILELPNSPGYSAAGEVVAIGSGVENISIGDRVACAGAGYASHAEYIVVPKNLVVKIPDSISYKSASTVAIGAIAMQGFRQANTKLGDIIAIFGLGIIGQITAQIAKNSGSIVYGIDLDERRLEIAKLNGVDYCIKSDESLSTKVHNLTNGFGVDSVIITASSHSDQIISQSFNICRKKGRVVLVGDVGLNIKRTDMYEKELELLISTSYGPGRYDENYEEKGLDYPYHYVRWTENRNMAEFLRMIQVGAIKLDNLIEREFLLEDIESAYNALVSDNPRPLAVVLKYSSSKEEYSNIIQLQSIPQKVIKGRINIAIIGVGEFASSVHLPNLMNYPKEFNIYAIMSRDGIKAKSTAVKYGARYATTDYSHILNDDNIHAVMICTRHNLHASLTIQALKKGKAVFVEKPIALNIEDLSNVLKCVQESGMPFMVGYNRRFSLYIKEIKEHLRNVRGPKIISYRMNAGFLPYNHWIYSSEGGGRIIGEACHIIDLFCYLIDSEIKTISVDYVGNVPKSIEKLDNVIITLSFGDGSVCSLVYTSLGNTGYPKEVCDIYFDNKIIILEDYNKMRGYGVDIKNKKTRLQEKGLNEELYEFWKSFTSDNKYPIPLNQLRESSLATLSVDSLIKEGD